MELPGSGPIKQELHYQEHTGVLTSAQTQPTEDLILGRNAELRKNPGVLKDLGQGSEGGTWGRQIASIPMIVFDAAIRQGFDLNNTDAKYGAREMQRFLATPTGKTCLVRGK